ncbi:helix-turn-helix domain-containing protein [Lactococcus sp. DD01]|uniref:helix-turn-helix domain-containing protein n=1 Tax=Lactococcus sp. DD01 TaxID=1776443 RepID=UPI00077651C0|nr:helix-turn-helix transcriptional regulator [Lactococcus sp. DD01]KXT63194.1 hypothetical protein LACDD01_00138 [Lactococcus sp. DD01]
MNNFPERLKSLRLEAGLSQPKLAEQTGISPSAVQSYELNRREAKTTQLIALADFFDVSLDYLVGRSDER